MRKLLTVLLVALLVVTMAVAVSAEYDRLDYCGILQIDTTITADSAANEAYEKAVEEEEAREDAAKVNEKIDKLDEITVDNYAKMEIKVRSARASYNGLSDLAKTFVNPAMLAKLEAAEQAIVYFKEVEEAEAAKSEAAEFDAQVAVLSEITADNYSSMEIKVIITRDNYNFLSDLAKSFVDPASLEKLEAAEKAILYFKLLANAPKAPSGDVNGDNAVNSDDAIHLLRHTLLPDRFPIDGDGDMNGDGVVNSNDAIHLLRYTLLPDRFPLGCMHEPALDAAVAPTCIDKGLTEGYHCSKCGTILMIQHSLRALGHECVEGICSRCGEVNPSNVTFRFLSNGDGTCYVSDIIINPTYTEEFVLTIPDQSPDGDVVTAVCCDPFYQNDLVPRLLLAEDFERITAELERAIGGTHNYNRFISFFEEQNISKATSAATIRSMLNRFPIAEIAVVYSLDAVATSTDIQFLQDLLLGYCSGWSAASVQQCYNNMYDKIAQSDSENKEAMRSGILCEFGNTNIIGIEIPETVQEIDVELYMSCRGLKSLILPDCISNIPDHAFSAHVNLTNVVLPQTLTWIGKCAFSGCDRLASVAFGNTNDWYYTDDLNATEKSSIDVTDSSTNAINLTGEYGEYYWKRK